MTAADAGAVVVAGDPGRIARPARRLRRALHRAGLDVAAVAGVPGPIDRDTDPDDRRVHVVAAPMDLTAVPPAAPLVGWAATDQDTWLDRGDLDLLDELVVPADRDRFAAAFAGPVTVATDVARVAELVDAVRTRPAEPLLRAVIANYPDYRHNPYTTALYAALRDRRARHVSVDRPDALVDSRRTAGARPVLHVQWTRSVLLGAVDPDDARRRVATFLADIDRAVDAGAALIWTVHNVLPHECPEPAIEADLRSELAGRADAVHVLCEATVEAVGEHYRLPADRTVVIRGAVPPPVGDHDRERARASFGLADDEFTLLAFGQQRAYKDPLAVLDAFAAFHARRPHSRLIVAGALGRFAGADRFAERCRTSPGVTADLGFVAASDVGRYFAAADAVLVSYPGLLNSSVAWTALAAGRPVVGPRRGGLAEEITADTGLLYEPGEDLASVLGRATRLATPHHRAAARRAAAAYPPDAMATAFADLVDDVLAR